MQIQNYVHKHIYSLQTIPYKELYVYVHIIKINMFLIKLFFVTHLLFSFAFLAT